MSSNRLGVEGGKAIADALRVNEALTSVDLQFNSLESAGAPFNSLGSDGKAALQEAVRGREGFELKV